MRGRAVGCGTRVCSTMCFHLSVDKYSMLVGGVGNSSTAQDDDELTDVVILCVCTVQCALCAHCATIKRVADAHIGVYGDCKTFKWC